MKQPFLKLNQRAYRNTHKLIFTFVGLASISGSVLSASAASQLAYPIVDTHQKTCFDTINTLSTCPSENDVGFGQDAQYQGFSASYTDNNNGTVSDNNTRLVWAKSIDINGDGNITVADKMNYKDALNYTENLNLSGYDDWRIPSIKELYSLMMFDGQDPSGIKGKGDYQVIPFIDKNYFGYYSGDTKSGERLIDAQYLSSTKYVSTTMKGDQTVFGVNFIDGRIKGYGLTMPFGKEKKFYILAVRGNKEYGINQFVDNKNGTVTDKGSDLIWQKVDSERGMDWPAALAYCEDLKLAGRDDWRLPNVKALQSIVDYSRSPDTTNSAAINHLFIASHIINEAGNVDYANYWSSTTHLNLENAKQAAYVSFGRSVGYMGGSWLDVHGAGAQRSDPKTGDITKFKHGRGPQGDAIRIKNYVRCVTGGHTDFIQQPIQIQRIGVTFTLNGEESISKNQNRMKQTNDRSAMASKKESVDIFKQLDINNDNKISRSEAKGPLKNDFDRLDANQDNYLVVSEIPNRSSHQ